MKLRRNARHAAGKDLACFGRKLDEYFWVGRCQLLDRDVLPAAGHLAVRLAEIDAALDGLWLGHKNLAEFAVKGAAFEEVIKLYFLQSTRSAEAFFVTRGDVTRCRFALGFRLGAF